MVILENILEQQFINLITEVREPLKNRFPETDLNQITALRDTEKGIVFLFPNKYSNLASLHSIKASDKVFEVLENRFHFTKLKHYENRCFIVEKVLIESKKMYVISFAIQ